MGEEGKQDTYAKTPGAGGWGCGGGGGVACACTFDGGAEPSGSFFFSLIGKWEFFPGDVAYGEGVRLGVSGPMGARRGERGGLGSFGPPQPLLFISPSFF